jgi:peptide/nickel transport system substrate-binding protein
MKARLAGLAIAGALSAYLCTPAAADLDPAHKGGTMRLVAVGAGGTIDPHINYTLQYWQLYQSIYDGLVTFKHADGVDGFTIVPDLAEELPTPGDDGKSYTFKVRKGIKFSNGQELTVKDVVASLQRIFKVKGPTAGGFYSVIVGADKCLQTPETCTLEGGVSADEAANTVTIHLTQPDPEIFQKLAVPHAVIVPADSPTTDVGTQALPGTGAYTIAAYDPNKQLKIVRNPNFKEWSADAQPDGYPDEIDYDFGLTDEAEINAIENGEADWTLDPPPPDRLVEIGTKYKDQVHVNTLTAWWYAPLNVNIAPFNNVKARQALNYAVDRDALVNLFGGPVLRRLPVPFPAPERLPLFTPRIRAVGAGHGRPTGEDSGAGQEVVIISEDYATRRTRPTTQAVSWAQGERRISSNIQFTYIQNTNNNVDQRLAVVPGLSGGFGLPEHPVRLRFLPSRLRFLRQHLGLLRQGRGGCADEEGAGARRHGSSGRQQAVGADRQGDHGTGAGGAAVHAQACGLPLQARRQLQVQRAVLLGRHAVLGEVTLKPA